MISSLALIVGDALCLRCAGILRCEGQNHQGDYIGKHIVNVIADPDLRQQVNAVAIDIQCPVAGGDTLEQSEQQADDRNIQRLPITEDHNCHGKITKAGNCSVCRPV